jgi:uncharacterized cupredoxin-like copper-binding protein/Cu/Ag efflux protein CusF
MRLLIALLLVLSAPALAHDKSHAEQSFGRPGEARKATREILVTLTDEMRFRPESLTVRQGETVRFRVKNTGKAMHEMVLGTLADLKAHAGMMRKHPGMEHDEPHMVHVAPGKTATMVWQFTQPGEFHYGCLVAGHFEAGMVGKLTVTSYAGQQEREIKSLSADEVKQYLSGAGMGYAKSAELNHFPGPMHALELADKLALSPEQKQKTQALMAAHKAEARAIGAKVVEAEKALEALFRTGSVDAAALRGAVERAGMLQAEYRLSHLETHRQMRALLTPDQVKRYDELRGYGKPGHGAGHRHHSMGGGEIRRVDREASKVTIKHGPMDALDMPAMTMVFQVKDPALLDNLKAGDQVMFQAEKAGSGFVVTKIEPAK